MTHPLPLSLRIRRPATSYRLPKAVLDGRVPGIHVDDEGRLVYPWSASDVVAAWGASPSILVHRPSVTDALMRPEALAQYRDWQIAESDNLIRTGGGTLWTSPGAGKTWVALRAALALALEDGGGAVLYVTKKILRSQVAVEVQRLTKATPVVWYPPSTQSAGWALEDAMLRAPTLPVVIVTWNQVRDDVEKMLQMRFPVVVYDEVQTAKNPKALNYSKDVDTGGWNDPTRVHTIAGMTRLLSEQVRYRIALTATPGDNDREDLYAQLAAVEPHAWGKSGRKFAVWYCGAVKHPAAPSPWALTTDTRYGAIGPTHTDEFAARLARVARRIPYQMSHGHLPPLHRRVIIVRPDEQDAPLDRHAKERRALARSNDPGAQGQLRELDYEEAADRVRSVAIDLFQQYRGVGKGKCLHFTGRKKLISVFQSKLRAFDHFELHGGQSDEQNDAAVLAYRAHPGPAILHMTYQKGGTGLNLEDTDLILYSMVPETPGYIEQSEGRGDRVTRKRTLEIIYLVASGTIIAKDLANTARKAADVADVHQGSRIESLAADLSPESRMEETMLNMVARLIAESKLDP